MSDLIFNNQYVPVPERERREHEPKDGDLFVNKSREKLLKIIKKVQRADYFVWETEEYNFLKGVWIKGSTQSNQSLKEYYTLVLGPFEEILDAASKAVEGDDSAITALLEQADDSPEAMAIMATRPSEQVLALTETSERLQDKLQTIHSFMGIIIEQKRAEMEARQKELNKHLGVVKDYVKNLQRIITVLNLYTGTSVDIKVICEGEPAPADEPIRVRQRILFMDEEILANAEDGGIDHYDIGLFYEWVKEQHNLNIVCPESKCIVAMKPKRYEKNYTGNYWDDKTLNKWNHHTMVLFRDGERLLMIDSEDLELYGTAIAYSDQPERYEQRYQDILKRYGAVSETEMRTIKKESEDLAYMYTKYMCFLQGVVDSGKIFDLRCGRPNFAKGDGVEFVYDDEKAIGTGRSWEEYKQSLNRQIRRGTRVIFFPFREDGYGRGTACGEPSRDYWHDASAPPAPKAGIYNVDYPSKTEHVKDPQTGRFKAVTGKGKKLAIFYTPNRCWSETHRNEAWIYNPECVINYDLLTIEDLDAFMADRTQRPTFRAWMPLLQQARRQLKEEAFQEKNFIALMVNETTKDYPQVSHETLETAIKDAVAWWKNKVIFTRPLRSDDAKAWRMIKSQIKKGYPKFIKENCFLH